MKKNLFLLIVLFVAFSCDRNDTKTYFIKIINDSEYCLMDISIEMRSLISDSLFVDSLAINCETEKFKFRFDRTSYNGCMGGTAISLVAGFNGVYTQNDSLKQFSTGMGNDYDFVTIIIDNESYTVLEN
ncbi:MAG: hypothetical protein K8S23_14835 [Candidatus Cloacimonetes bacterium]|nr:hypothetical protein [Candidatus Cloacimonadota bacterium]